jgi:hypothetical protein
MSEAKKLKPGPKRKLTDSTRIRNKKAANAKLNKHNLYRMSSNLRSIAYDLHYCPGSKNYRTQNKMTFSPEKSEWFMFFVYLIFTYIRNF